LIDFDLAGPVGEQRSEEFWVGTPAFVAPEEVEGAPSSFAGDIYSAGVVLFWSLFGCLPFDGSAAEVARAHREREVSLPTHLGNTRLEAFLLTCLAKDPGQRFQNATEAQVAFLALFRD
jgi:serine/threonine-protein kinase